jgi:FAD/FMN-containing dehydrogenase
MAVRKEEIQARVRGEVYDDRGRLEAFSTDTSLFRVRPELIVAPQDASDICALVSYAREVHERGGRVTLTARSAGTDMTGGPLTEGVVLDMTAHVNRLVSLSDTEATVEPGMYFRDFDRETTKLNRILPSYPASRELCTVGGMVSNNSGGEKTLRWGKTADYVRKLSVVLADGHEYEFRKLTRAALIEKQQLAGFEGELYRKMAALVIDNYDALQAAKPDVTKNSSGYALWDVYDPTADTFDLTRLFTGSQGTLGIVTEATLSLTEPEPYSKLLVVFLKTTDQLAALVNVLRATEPESMESYDDHTFTIALKLFPQIAKRLGGNLLLLGLRFIPEFFAALTGGVPKLVLLVEYTGKDAHAADLRARAGQAAIVPFHLKSRITTSTGDAAKYWTVRRESFNLLRQKLGELRTAPFIDDLVVRPDVLPEFLPKLTALLETYPLTYTIAGHMGDGNFHIIPLMNLRDPKTPGIIHDLMVQVQRLVWSYHGSNTGEHNDGILRTPYLKEMYGETVYRLFEETKRIFDPLNIFNPGKKVGGSEAYFTAHIDTGIR